MAEESVDLKGQPVRKQATGRWRACWFLVAYEACERMAFYSISANLVVFLTTQLHEGTVSSSTNVSNWGGAIWLSPILGAYLADAFLGRYWTFTLFSLIYIVGMCCLTLAVSLPSLKPPPCPTHLHCPRSSTTQIGFFYFSLYTLCFGTGGTKPNISALGADQFEDRDREERLQKNSFFNWWTFSICFGTLFGMSVLVYIQDNVGWGWGYGVPTLALIVSVLIFVSGTKFYRHKRPAGDPFSRIAQVFVAALRNRHRSLPADTSSLYETKHLDETCGATPLLHTARFRFLDKAAVIDQNEFRKEPTVENPWRLCPVTQVEETKLIVGVLPIWLADLMLTATFSNINTFFVKQATTLDTKIGPRFRIPPASLSSFVSLGVIISIPMYDKLLVPWLRRFTGNDRGITILQRMGMGMLVQIFGMFVAALIEIKRLRIVREHELLDSRAPLPMSVFWLLPQFFLMGVSETFAITAMLEFFYDQAPTSMKSIGTAIYTTSIGIGFFLSSSLITIVHKFTSRGGRTGWLVDNLNRCHLDYYYWFLIALLTINLGIFLLLAHHYTYKAAEAVTIDVQITELSQKRQLTPQTRASALFSS